MEGVNVLGDEPHTPGSTYTHGGDPPQVTNTFRFTLFNFFFLGSITRAEQIDEESKAVIDACIL